MEETTSRGSAVAETATIQHLTLPNGSKQMVSSDKTGHDYLVVIWIEHHFYENPDRWLDLADLYRFVNWGDPPRSRRRLDVVTKPMRNIVRRARRLALREGKSIITKTDKRGGVTHFKLENKQDIKDRHTAIELAANDRRMQTAWDNRVDRVCEAVDTDTHQLDEINKAKNLERARHA